MVIVVVLFFYLFHKINSKNKTENMSNTSNVDISSINALTELAIKLQEGGVTIPDNLNTTGLLKITNHGKETTYGSQNEGWSHITTDAPAFYMNKNLQVDGGISSYNNQPLKLPHGANITGNIDSTGTITGSTITGSTINSTGNVK